MRTTSRTDAAEVVIRLTAFVLILGALASCGKLVEQNVAGSPNTFDDVSESDSSAPEEVKVELPTEPTVELELGSESVPPNGTVSRLRAPSSISDEVGFWRSFSMEANWINAYPSFSESIRAADVAAFANVTGVRIGEPRKTSLDGVELRFIELQMETVLDAEGSAPKSFTLLIESPGSSVANGSDLDDEWIKRFESPPTGTVFVTLVRVESDPRPDVYRIMSDWSIWVQGESGIETAFDDATHNLEFGAPYLAVAGTVSSMGELAALVSRPGALVDAEREV
jgi:hypothetical protein